MMNIDGIESNTVEETPKPSARKRGPPKQFKDGVACTVILERETLNKIKAMGRISATIRGIVESAFAKTE
jgi:hypothetical protein